MSKIRSRWKNVFLIILSLLLIAECAGIIYLMRSNSALQEMVSAAQTSLQQNEQLLEEKNDERTSQEAELGQLKTDLSQKESEIASLQQTLADSSAQLSTSNQQLTEIQSKVNELQQQINDKTSKIDELNKQIEQLKISKQQKSEAEAVATAAASANVNSTQAAQTKKVAYITFDDGPSEITPQVLDILDKYNAKATFFVVYQDSSNIVPYYNEIVNRGHQIAIHTASHQYTQIYASVDAYVADFNKIRDYVAKLTGVNCTLFRFPGGSKNNYNKAIADSLIDYMQNKGYTYFDWNISIDDAVKNTSVDQMVSNVLDNIDKRKTPVILCHDGSGHADTVTALPRILQGVIDKGYTFEKLSTNVTPIQFGKNW